MKLIETKEQYLDIVRAFQSKSIKECFTNMYYSVENLECIIKEKRLFFTNSDDNIWFMVDEGPFYTGYFYYKSSVLRLNKQNKPVVVELIGNQKRYDEKAERELITSGFKKYHKNLELVSTREDFAKIKKDNELNRSFFQRHSFHYCIVSDSNISDMNRIWEEVIDSYAVKQMSKRQQEVMIEKGRGIVICDDDDNTVAAGMYEMTGSVCVAFHIAVTREYNSSGLGAAVMTECAYKAFSEGCKKYISWISDDNEESINIHSRIGTFTGKYSQQFIL